MLRLLGPRAVEPTASKGRVRLAVWSPAGTGQTSSSLATAGGVSVLFSGYLCDVPQPYRGEASYVLARYLAGDWAWLRSASGVFAFAVVDAAGDRCVLGVDRLGIRPLFFTHDERGVVFASVLGALLPWCPSATLDVEALQETRLLGFPLGNSTLLRGVERVGPGTCLEIRSSGRRARRYWALDELPSIRAHDLEAFVDESRERLRHAIRRLLARSATAPMCLLSSGWDSRRLLLESHALGVRLDTATTMLPYVRKPGTTIERAVVGELCRRLGLANRSVLPPGPGAAVTVAQARKVRDTLLDDQVFGPYHVWSIPLVGSLPPSDTTWNFDGLLGDTFLANPFYALPRAVWGKWRVGRDLLDAIAPGHQHHDRAWKRLVSRSLASRLTAALNALPEGPHRLSFFYLLGRTRRMIALLPYGLIDLRVESFCPYLDTEVMDHALSIDPRVTADHDLQRLALARHFPAYTDIPSSHSPPAEIPARYFDDMRFTDREWSGRFTVADLGLLLRGCRPRGGPAPSVRDLAVAALATLRYGAGPGRWREPLLRDAIQTVQLVDRMHRGGAAEAMRRRAEAFADLDRCAEAAAAEAPRGRG